MNMRLLGIVAAAAFLAAGADRVAGGSSAPSFGDTLTADAKLAGDLSGTGTGLVVGADGITIDLNGYTLSMTGGSGWGIDNTGGYDDVTVKNGTIEGFDEGVRAVGADGLVLKDLDVSGATGSGLTSAVVHVFDSDDVTIQGCAISLSPVFGGPHCIRLDTVVDVKVQNCDIDGGFTGVAFFSVGGLYGEGDPTTGSVQNCTISDCASSGVLLANTTKAQVSDNVITGCAVGMQVGIHEAIPPTGVHIADNVLTENLSGGLDLRWLEDSKVTGNVVDENDFFGILLRWDCVGNTITKNEVNDNGYRGIIVLYDSNDNTIADNEVNDNGLEGITLLQGTCTGNKITDNTATGNGVWDLYHNADSTPNKWDGNTYDAAYGSDID